MPTNEEEPDPIKLCPECNAEPACTATCPYDDEIRNIERQCDCCRPCRKNCLMDV
jgi:hypothetical protein